MNAIVPYILEKHKQLCQRDNYVMDCLWALATERRFQDKQNQPTLQRWHDIIQPKEISKPKIMGSEIMHELLTAW